MVKKDKEFKNKVKQKYKEDTKKQTKVLKNLHKLDKKRKKMFLHISSSKSTYNLHRQNRTERYELGLTMSKNLSMLRSGSKVNFTSQDNLLQTQKKPKRKKIAQIVESPSKILSSDSEFDEMSPKKYFDYCNVISQVNSETADKYRMMPLQRSSDQDEIYRHAALDKIESDGLKEINDGTQHGWLASQQETDNESDVPMISNIKHSMDESKSKHSHDKQGKQSVVSQI
jgi:hypothetical protein